MEENENKEVVQLPGGLIRIGERYVARDGFNVVAALHLLSDGKPIKVSEFAKTFGSGNTKLGRRKAKQWIRRLAKAQYHSSNPIIGIYDTYPDGSPIPNGMLLEIQMYTASGSEDEREALRLLREKKEHLGKKLLGEASWLAGLEEKEPTVVEPVPA